MSRKDNKYGIAKGNILAQGLTKPNEQRTALLGTAVKIENILANGSVAIKFLDKSNSRFEDVLYHGKQADIIPVAERLWPLLNAIPSPLDRVSVASNAALCDELAALQIHSNVEVLHNKIFHSALIKYIGPIEAMGGGHYFGLELLSRTQITTCDGSYADKHYFYALPGTALFVSIDKIRQVTSFLSTLSKKYHNYPTFDSLTQDLNPNYETIHNEAKIMEKPRHILSKAINSRNAENVDLIDIIGGSWPGVTENKINVNVTHEPIVKVVRNKSLNPVSQLINARKTVRVPVKNDGGGVHIGTNTTVVGNAVASTSQNTEPRLEDVDDRNSNTTYDTPADSVHLSVGTLVEVVTDISDPLYGVIRWVGEGGLAGVELEEDHDHLPLVLTDGQHNGHRYFQCSNGRGLFVPISQCQKDSRFEDPPQAQMNSSKMFGGVDSPVVPGSVPPLSMPTEEDVQAVCGKYRGIQGHHNSCYLDATLFAMFTYTGVFDSLLFRPRAPNDISHYEEVQRVLREEIVNPLRQNLYVRADRVMKLRTLLEDLSSVSGLTSEEKDPEEFLNSLLAQILKAEPFLKLSSGQEAFHYQLFVEKDEGLALPSVQQLFEQSFLSSDIKLKEVPSCLIIQMPRFGKNFKMYPRILPSQLLDVTDIIENSPRQCTVCGKLAQYECRDCFGQCGVGLESTGFCANCLETAHCHVKRSAHSPKPLTVPQDFAIIAEHCPPPRLYMELFAVVCIETSHYVAFVKCGSGHEAPWCFFDSMADRKGEINGYNIPEMVACPDVSHWLSDDGAVSRHLHEANPHDKQLPEHARRLLCDAYICMYQSPDVMMYR